MSLSPMPMSEPFNKTLAKGLRGYFAATDLGEMHLCGTGSVADLEEKLKRHYGVKHALCVSNATTGVLGVALALGLRGAEFVTSPYTYGASLAGWLLLGNKPCFADIDPQTLTLDPKAVRKALRSKTKALLAVDIFGTPADQVALKQVADDYGLWYIADAAQSLGAVRNGVPASKLADALVVSFTTGKSVFAGEGGAVLTNNGDIYEKVIWYTQHPARQRRELGLHLDNEFGINGRIHPLGAVWASAVFEESLRKLRLHQGECFRIIDFLNSWGWTEGIHFRRNEISPTFFRLTAAWKGKPQVPALLEELRGQGITATLEAPPVRLLYKQPALVEQYGRRFRIPHPCYQAERQVLKRFGVLIKREKD